MKRKVHDMLFYTRLRLVGMERLTTRKGNDYLKLAFVQGADTIQFLTNNFGYEKAKLFDEYEVTLSWNAQYRRMEFEGMKTV